MNHKALKTVLFAALVLLSATCFVYVNTTSIDRTLSVEVVKTEQVDVNTNSKMPDLVFMKSMMMIFHKFLPAK